MLEGQNDDSFLAQTVVTLANPTNTSPVTNTPPILYVQTGLPAATVQINATDPDGDPITFSLSTSAQSAMAPAVPSVVTSLSSTGLLTLNTVGKGIGNKYATQAIVTDANGATVPLDFIMQVVGVSTPPTFDYSVTPTNGATIKVQPGTPIAFSIKAFDTDAGATVALNSTGIPAGATVGPQVGTNPATISFNWTPTVANLGSYALSFSATDNILVQSLTNVNIVVSLAPVFNIPPTPATASYIVVAPNDPIAFTVEAQDPDPLDACAITEANGLDALSTKIPIYAGVSMLPALPTTAANTTSTLFNWTPTQAQWGKRHVIFTAEDGYGDKTDHEVSILVNTTPQFSSTPVTSVIAGQLYTYLITGIDPDVPFGDELEIHSSLVLPSWLTLVDNGNGTATLSGTPSLLDAGLHPIELQLEDIYHHQNIGGIPVQLFDINVIPCTISIAGTATDVACPGGNDGALDITLSGVFGNPTFSWTGPASFAASSEDISGLAAGTYHVTVSSDLGCTELASFTVGTTPDVTPPTITCPAPISVSNDVGICGAKVCYPAPLATDNCGPATPVGYTAIASYGNSYYFMRTSTTNYATAEAEAAAAGGHLAVITSAAENAAMQRVAERIALLAVTIWQQKALLLGRTASPMLTVTFLGQNPTVAQAKITLNLWAVVIGMILTPITHAMQ